MGGGGGGGGRNTNGSLTSMYGLNLPVTLPSKYACMVSACIALVTHSNMATFVQWL